MLRSFLFLFFFVFIPSVTLAAPSFSLEDDQSFSKYQGLAELRLFSIIDTDGEISKDSGVKINIPEAFPSIYYMSYTQQNMVVYGTAVDNGKVEANIVPSFENKGKTLVIPVKEDFEKGETLYIKQVWLKDLYASSDSYYPILEYGEGETVSSPKYLSVKTSSSSNSQAPDSPYNQKLEVADGNKVKVSWEDPYDLDVTQIILLRGKNTPASGTVFSYIALGAQEYIDEDVSIGDKMQYYIIATDGRNRSLLGDPLEITVTEYVAPVLEDVIEEESEEVEESESEITTDNEEDLKEELESDVAEKEIVYSRKELQEQAKDVMQISKPLDRIKSVRSQLKKFTKFTDKIWFMRYVIQERNK